MALIYFTNMFNFRIKTSKVLLLTFKGEEMKIKKILIIVFAIFSLQSNVHSEETYMYGGAKYFSYGVEKK